MLDGGNEEKELAESIDVFFDDSHYSDQWLQNNDDGDYYEMQGPCLNYMLIDNHEFAKQNSVIGINFADPEGCVMFTGGLNQASAVNPFYSSHYSGDDVHVEAAYPYHLVDPHHIMETEPERKRDLLDSEGKIYTQPVFGGANENAVHDLLTRIPIYEVINNKDDEALGQYERQQGLDGRKKSAASNLLNVKSEHNKEVGSSEENDHDQNDVKFGFDP